MNRLYQKNKLTFSLVWIGLYVVLFSLADAASEALGVEKLVTALTGMVMTAVLLLWLRKNGLMEEYGLCRFRGNARDYLYFLPLVLICSANLWLGLQVNLPLHESMLYVLSMLCVGILEEVIFRGLLLRAMQEQGTRHAVLISGLTFGIGHVVNLLNGAAFLPTMMQICYAVAIGVLFAVIFCRSGSLIPCIAVHCLFNSLSVIAPESGAANPAVCAALIIIPLAYAAWIWKRASLK